MSRRRKPLWIVLGWLLLALALVGVFLPIIPQVPFAIAAAFAFSKGNPRLHRWILNHRNFGAAVRDWEMAHIIRMRLKLFSISTMIVGAALAYWKYRDSSPVTAFSVPLLFAIAIVYVATRPGNASDENLANHGDRNPRGLHSVGE